jgi:putative NIF3 family GTP cyclohydrolase 1 type 2
MKACEIAVEFEKVAPVSMGIPSDRQAQVLGFRFGNPDVEVTGVGVGWLLTMEVIRAAIAKGVNMLLIHEPEVFFTNNSPWHTCLIPETNPVNLAKKRLLLEHDICVYTAHSNWDLQPEVGMQPTFAKALGLTNEIKRDIAVGVYRIDPMPFSALVEKVKKATGLAHMRVQGDANRQIKTVAVAFGLMGKLVDAVLVNKADAGIFGELPELGFHAARDADVPVIETTHVVSESIGFRSAYDVMKARVPGVRFEFLEVDFPYRWA